MPRKHNKGRRKISQKIAQFSLLDLETIPQARRVWGQIIVDYELNKRSSAKSRDLNSFMKTLLSFMLGEKDAEFERRLTEIEAEILAIKQERKMEIVR